MGQHSGQVPISTPSCTGGVCSRGQDGPWAMPGWLRRTRAPEPRKQKHHGHDCHATPRHAMPCHALTTWCALHACSHTVLTAFSVAALVHQPHVAPDAHNTDACHNRASGQTFFGGRTSHDHGWSLVKAHPLLAWYIPPLSAPSSAGEVCSFAPPPACSWLVQHTITSIPPLSASLTLSAC